MDSMRLVHKGGKMFGRKALPVIAVFVAIFLMTGIGVAATGQPGPKAKYIFVFIGDGMGVAQRNAAELYLGKLKGVKRPEDAKLVMNTFPAQGMDTTYDLTSVIPDSSSTATAISTGHKTASAVVGMDAEGKVSYENIAETAKKKNWKIGILTTVSLDHATPAAFYAHVPSRRQMYDISIQLANSSVDYFAGGQLMEPVDKKDRSKPNALDEARKNGYTIATGRGEFEALKPGSGRVIAMNALVDDRAAMYFSLDRKGGGDNVTIAEYLVKGMELLDNPNGFFIMLEGGRIDWACHANDAAASIYDTLALDDAVAEAVRFYEKHPGETLIVVTADHETGGMAIGFAGTQYSSFMDKIKYQKMSSVEFANKLSEYKKAHSAQDAKLEDLMPLITEAFGLFIMPADERPALEKAVSDGKANGASEDTGIAAGKAAEQLKHGMALSEREIRVLREALKQSMLDGRERAKDDDAYLLYGGQEPLAVKLTTILDNKAGIGWTSYVHTGVPVQTSALGVGAETFNGYYDETDIYTKIMAIAGFRP